MSLQTDARLHQRRNQLCDSHKKRFRDSWFRWTMQNWRARRRTDRRGSVQCLECRLTNLIEFKGRGLIMIGCEESKLFSYWLRLETNGWRNKWWPNIQHAWSVVNLHYWNCTKASTGRIAAQKIFNSLLRFCSIGFLNKYSIKKKNTFYFAVFYSSFGCQPTFCFIHFFTQS